MEEHGLVGMKEGTGGKSAKEAGSAVGKSSAKEGSVEGVEKRKEEGGKGGGGVKAVKEKEKKKEKRKTSTVSTGEEAEGDIRDEHPDTDGGEAAPPTGKDTIKQKDRKTKTKKVKEAKEKVEGKRTAKDTLSREYIGEQLLLIEAEPHKKLLMDLNTADPWTVQVIAACLTHLFLRCTNGCGHFQAASSEPMFPLSAVVINHLGKVGGELMEAEVRIYEQGICHTVATAWSLVLPSSPSFLIHHFLLPILPILSSSHPSSPCLHLLPTLLHHLLPTLLHHLLPTLLHHLLQ